MNQPTLNSFFLQPHYISYAIRSVALNEFSALLTVHWCLNFKRKNNMSHFILVAFYFFTFSCFFVGFEGYDKNVSAEKDEENAFFFSTIVPSCQP